jgi:hypothetical protein
MVKAEGFITPSLGLEICVRPGANAMKLFTAVNYKHSQNAIAFAPSKVFQLSLMFADMARAYPSEAPSRCSTLGSWPYPQTLYEESVVDKFKSNLLLMIIWLNIINYNS